MWRIPTNTAVGEAIHRGRRKQYITMPPSVITIDWSAQRQLSDCSLFTMDDICSSWSNVVSKQVKDEKERDNETQVTLQTSPFMKYEGDGYEYPTLYEECDEMLQACILVYPMADLRRLVREGVIEDTDGMILKLPLTATQVIQAVEKYKDVLVDTNAFGQEFHVDILKAVEERQMYTVREKGASPEIHDDNLESSILVAFDDEFEKEELVYAIAVNPVRKRITVVFRGSITKTDWATNMETSMKEVPNPMASRHMSQDPTLFVHQGFHDYLFSPTERGATGPDGKPLSEYEEILQEHVLPVIAQYPGYKVSAHCCVLYGMMNRTCNLTAMIQLYITGHSLGGALSTLFAFEAAAMPDDVVPKPVSCFTFGAPYVGGESFRQANRLLQGLGKLRHMRVCNHKDLVTTIPKMAFKLNIFDTDAHVGTLFKHTGMNLKLFQSANEPVEVSFPMVRTGWFNSFHDEFIRGWDQSLFSNLSWSFVDYTWHKPSEYNRRLLTQKKRLKRMYLNDLYSRDDIVGRLVAEF